MSTKPPCRVCGYVHASDWARAINLFRPDLTIQYHADYRGAPPRFTRREAESDMCKRKATQ